MWAAPQRLEAGAEPPCGRWIKLLAPEQQELLEQARTMGAAIPTFADPSPEPSGQPASENNPATTPIPEEPRPEQPHSQEYLAQQEWYSGQDSFFSGYIPPEIPWQDDDLTAQAAASSSQQPPRGETTSEPTSSSPDQDPWMLPKPDTRLFNIFGEATDRPSKGKLPGA